MPLVNGLLPSPGVLRGADHLRKMRARLLGLRGPLAAQTDKVDQRSRGIGACVEGRFTTEADLAHALGDSFRELVTLFSFIDFTFTAWK